MFMGQLGVLKFIASSPGGSSLIFKFNQLFAVHSLATDLRAVRCGWPIEIWLAKIWCQLLAYRRYYLDYYWPSARSAGGRVSLASSIAANTGQDNDPSMAIKLTLLHFNSAVGRRN